MRFLIKRVLEFKCLVKNFFKYLIFKYYRYSNKVKLYTKNNFLFLFDILPLPSLILINSNSDKNNSENDYSSENSNSELEQDDHDSHDDSLATDPEVDSGLDSDEQVQSSGSEGDETSENESEIEGINEVCDFEVEERSGDKLATERLANDQTHLLRALRHGEQASIDKIQERYPAFFDEGSGNSSVKKGLYQVRHYIEEEFDLEELETLKEIDREEAKYLEANKLIEKNKLELLEFTMNPEELKRKREDSEEQFDEIEAKKVKMNPEELKRKREDFEGVDDHQPQTKRVKINHNNDDNNNGQGGIGPCSGISSGTSSEETSTNARSITTLIILWLGSILGDISDVLFNLFI